MITIKANNEATIKELLAFSKFLNPKGVMAYQKYFYAKDNFLYITNGGFVIEIDLLRDIPDGYYSIVKQGKDLLIIPQSEIIEEYPNLKKFFDITDHNYFDHDNIGSFSMSYCSLIHALSSPDLPYCFDIEFFKLFPLETLTIYTEKIHTNRSPFVVFSQKYKFVIIPIFIG